MSVTLIIGLFFYGLIINPYPANEGCSIKKLLETKVIICYGNSLTAGLGVQPDQAFPALLENKIKKFGKDYRVINAGVSGETSADGLTRIDWILNQTADIFILELGGNDGLRGLPPNQTKSNLQAIIDKVKLTNPKTKIVIAGMMVPPNMGEFYSNDFIKIFPDLARINKLLLIPFLLENVGGNPDLNQADGIHPTPAGHKIVAENVFKVIKGIL
jgi:acyl-CoA thioesterase I